MTARIPNFNTAVRSTSMTAPAAQPARSAMPPRVTSMAPRSTSISMPPRCSTIGSNVGQPWSFYPAARGAGSPVRRTSGPTSVTLSPAQTFAPLTPPPSKRPPAASGGRAVGALSPAQTFAPLAPPQSIRPPAVSTTSPPPVTTTTSTPLTLTVSPAAGVGSQRAAPVASPLESTQLQLQLEQLQLQLQQLQLQQLQAPAPVVATTTAPATAATQGAAIDMKLSSFGAVNSTRAPLGKPQSFVFTAAPTSPGPKAREPRFTQRTTLPSPRAPNPFSFTTKTSQLPERGLISAQSLASVQYADTVPREEGDGKPRTRGVGTLGGTMEISVNIVDGTSFSLLMAPTDTGQDLKRKIETNSNIPPAQQQLVFAGKQLKDDRTMYDSGISKNCVIFCVPKAGYTGEERRAADKTKSSRKRRSVCPCQACPC